ncbi:MAG: PRC-barrel domain-containing protein [Pseudomonadota bacterium]
MLKHIVLATFLTCGAAAAYAQTPQQAANPPASAASPATAGHSAADASKLIGRDIQNMQNETIGEIESIYIGKDGKVDSVMVSVGGFLGIGDREVRIPWSDLNIANNGEKVTVNMTKDQLKAKPEYKYPNQSYRGQVFTDTGPWKDTNTTADTRRPSDMTRPADTAKGPQNANTAAANTTSTGDFNASGEMSANALIGASVRNQNRDAIGEIEDVYVDKDGKISTLVVSVGGFLGVGAKNVAVKWSDVNFARDGKSLVVTTNLNKDALKSMPDYKYERREQATQPAPATRSGG